MSEARDAVLSAVRRSLVSRTEAGTPPVAPAPAPAAAAEAGPVGRFAERAAEYHADVRRVSAMGVANIVAEVCSQHGVTQLACPSDLPEAWRPGGVTLLPESLTLQELDQVGGVLTGCSLAIAETGTIALDGGPAQGSRALTLVPDLHICIVLARQVMPGVADAVSRLGASVRERQAPITLVSGPSATSDIELSRVEGVHGPRRLVIVLAEE